MSKSDYAEIEVLKWCVGKAEPATSVGNRYVALFTTAPNAETGASGVEVSGGSYARKSTAAADWNTPSAGSVANANPITFVTPTGSWGTVVAFGIYDASTGGNLIRSNTLSTSKTIGTGDTPSFAAGALVCTED